MIPKSFFTLTLKCFDSLISFGSGHFEAGQSKNEDRIDTLIQQRKELTQLQVRKEQEEIESKKKTRRNWFGREEIPEEERESILYDDIDIEKTGFRKDSNNKD